MTREKNIEKMDIPVISEGGEVFDVADIYEGMHIKKRVLKKIAQDGAEIPQVIKEEIDRHLKICPSDPASGRISCRDIYDDFSHKEPDLPFNTE